MREKKVTKQKIVSLLEEMARSMYESNEFKRPWEHPATQEKYREVYFKYAKAARKAYERWTAAKQKRESAELAEPALQTVPVEPAPEPAPEPTPEPTEPT
jgi:hypothetical protein